MGGAIFCGMPVLRIIIPAISSHPPDFAVALRPLHEPLGEEVEDSGTPSQEQQTT